MFPVKLDAPVSLSVTNAFIESLKEIGVATSPHFSDFVDRNGWLAKEESFTFEHRIKLEGPAAFYGGVYGNKAWKVSGGLCSIGAASYTHSPVPEGMSIGRYCSIAKGLKFLDFMHPVNWISSSVAFFKPINTPSLTTIHHLIEQHIETTSATPQREGFDPKVGKPYPTLGHDVWIGENVTLAMGITIDHGAIIAANSVVTKDVPAFSIVGGVPAKFIKPRFPPHIIQDLLNLQWWKYSFTDLIRLDVTKPEKFLRNLRVAVLNERIVDWTPAAIVLPDALFQKN